MSGVHGQDGDEGGYGGGYGSYEGGGGGGYGGRGGGGGGYGGRGGGGGGYGGRGGGGGGGGAYGGGYQGDRGGRGGGGRGGGRGGGSGRDGDWRCPNPSCGNLNFARRTECNKCGVPSPASSDNTGGYNRGGRGGGGYENNRGGRGNYNDSGSGRGGNRHDSGSGRGSSYGHNQGRDDGGHGQDAQAAPPSYGGSTGNYGNPPRSYGGNSNNTSDTAPHGYMGGPTSYPPSYGNPAAYDRNAYDGNGSGGRGGSSGYGSGGRGGSSGYGGAPRDSGSYDTEEFSEKVKQCDETCGDSCDNARIYISNLPPDVTVDELRELFGSIGQVARIKQKRGYKDQWPWSIKIYTDEQGNSKGDAVLSYEDPSAAHSAGGFFNNHELKGHKISVSMAEKSAPKAPSYGSGGRGNYGGGRRDTYRDGGSSGPDRHYHGGNRSRPY